MTAGIANTIMIIVIRIAQAKSGTRSRDMPGARCLKIVTISRARHDESRHFGEVDDLDPGVHAVTRRVRVAGQRHIREPAAHPDRGFARKVPYRRRPPAR
jgi:hypothetical protein